MIKIQNTRNCVYQTAYHIVWIPKCRKRVLVSHVATRLEAILIDIASDKAMDILSVDIQPDHIHLFVSIPPAMPVAQAVKYFKGISARKLLMEFPNLRMARKSGSLWSPSYYVGTAGNVSAETIRRYIERTEHITTRR